jgi:Flp pilus assembly protein TadD
MSPRVSVGKTKIIVTYGITLNKRANLDEISSINNLLREMSGSFSTIIKKIPGILAFGCFTLWGNFVCAQSVIGGATNEIRIAELQGAVEIFPAGAKTWTSARTNQILHPFDHLRSGANSRVALLWSDQSVVPFGASTEIEILPPQSSDSQCGLHLIRGIISFFHRDKPGQIQIITRGAIAGVEGTEFVLAVDDADETMLSAIDGKVKFGNKNATLHLTNGEQAVVELGKTPVRTAGFIANNILQWCFYYPAILDLNDLPLTAEEQKKFSASLDDYRAGDLPAALEKFPAPQKLDSDSARIYYAALLLSVGEVEKSEAALSSLKTNSEQIQRLAAALRQLIAAVKRQPDPSTFRPKLPTEFLANSYFEQSRAVREISLERALNFTKQAATNSPQFGFAWERVAELEFSFGRTKNALDALNKSLALAPRNPEALALKGFLLAAQNKTREAISFFDRALAIDSALGNAWFGRGLCKIRLGDSSGGREDLLVAAALEPQRAELRSYLGKADANDGNFSRATKELELAKKLDANDPTAWLYSALLNQEKNQINQAIDDLEKSKELNDNRRVYRSQLLLDQDLAVRSADLAGIYRAAGMFDESIHEAGRAVSDDYANYSAHLFLANSYEQLRDPNWSNLRYETPATSEFWIANLFAPASAGTLSPVISEQPYSKWFEQNRVGVVSDTTYLSRGAWTQLGAQFGAFDNFSYDLEEKYIFDPGQRPNNDNENRDLTLTLKEQFTPRDSAFFTVEQDEIERGDVNEYYDQNSANSTLRVHETQNPNLFLGYHHEWSPGVHTLFFAARLAGDETVSASDALQTIAFNLGGDIFAVRGFGTPEMFTVSPEIYSTELQQIWEQPNHTTIVGARYQWGDLRYKLFQGDSFDLTAFAYFPDPTETIINQDFAVDFHRLTFYGYHNWQIADSFSIIGGISYDDLHLPQDVATTPFSAQEKSISQFSPKAGFIWTPTKNTTIRAAYTRSLSGAVDDQSIRIEPTEVAGFNQAFRSIIPESVVGNTSGSEFETYDVALEQKFDTGTYLSLAGEILYSKNQQLAGGYTSYEDQIVTNDFPTYPVGLQQSLNYRERSLTFTADQLMGKQWAAGARYRLSQANLDINYPAVPGNLSPLDYDLPFQPRQNLESVLHQVNFHINWNHPRGWFSSFEANWYHQNNSGFLPAEPGDDFWQFNAYAGWRFWHRKGEFTVGVLNLTSQNYQLEPLNLYNEMARSRTFLARVQINF